MRTILTLGLVASLTACQTTTVTTWEEDPILGITNVEERVTKPLLSDEQIMGIVAAGVITYTVHRLTK